MSLYKRDSKGNHSRVTDEERAILARHPKCRESKHSKNAWREFRQDLSLLVEGGIVSRSFTQGDPNIKAPWES